jgi:hypothetical protein
MRIKAAVVVAVICIASAVPASVASEVDHSRNARVLGTYTLGSGDSVFWNGEYVEKHQPTGPLPVSMFLMTDPVDYCSAPGQECFDYEIVVADEAARLRVALEVRGPDFGPPSSGEGDVWEIQMLDPNGELVRFAHAIYNSEAFVTDPAVGTWKVRVQPLDVTRSSFVMRARLDEEIPRPAKKGPLLPNLRSIPASDFGVVGPVGYQCGVMSCPRAEVAGRTLASCTPDEQAEQGVQSCLRFAVGSENAGEGPLDLLFTPLENGTQSRVTQVIHHADSTTTRRDAGLVEYHKTHAHYHLSAYAEVTLYEVLDQKGKSLAPVGTGRKNGFCLANERLTEWDLFTNEPDTTDKGRYAQCLSPVDGRMVQSAGWGDVYEYDRAGNYVPFEIRDGEFVLRSTVDAADVIEESNERDNVAYAWIRIAGDAITLVEHGYGNDPWDPRKVVSYR